MKQISILILSLFTFSLMTIIQIISGFNSQVLAQNNTHSVTLTWDSGKDTEIIGTITGTTSYPDIEGVTTFVTPEPNVTFDINTYEQKSGGQRITGIQGNDFAEVNTIWSTQGNPTTGISFTYGHWEYVSAGEITSFNFRFKPNTDAINGLQAGESVTTTIEYDMYKRDGMTNLIKPANFLAINSISITISGPPQLSIADASASENAGPIVFNVTMNSPRPETVTVNLATSQEAGDDAIVGTDFTNKTETLTFAAGETTKMVEVSIIDDSNFEPNETFTATISNPVVNPANVTATISDATATGTIENDDGLVQFTITGDAQLEDSGTMVIDVTSVGSPRGPININWETSSESDDTAEADTDYTSNSGTLRFDANNLVRTFSVQLIDDYLIESNETFTITFDNQNTDLGTIVASIKARIVNDDEPVQFSITGIEQSENAPEMMINVSASHPPGGTITINWTTSSESGDTAVANTDYTSASGTLSFDEINLIRTFSVQLRDNNQEGDNKTFTISFVNQNNDLGRIVESVKATIIDDESGLPRVVLETNQSQYTAGGSIKVILRVLPEQSNPLVVQLNINDENGVLLWRRPKMIELTSNQSFTFQTASFITENSSVTFSIDQDRNKFILTNPSREITVRPGNSGDQLERISVAEAVVTALLANPPSGNIESQFSNATSSSKPIVAINAVEPKIVEGSLAQFHIHASEKISRTIHISLNVQDNGNFIAGNVPQTIQLSPANFPYLISIETKDDTVATADGKISIEILASEDYVVGGLNIATVIVSDLDDRLRAEQVENLNQRVMSQLLSSVSERSVSTISNRLHYANDIGADPTFKFGNSHSLSSFITTNGELLNNNSNSWYSLLDGTSFSIPLNPEDRGDRATTIWGHGDYLAETTSSSQFARSATGEGYVGNFGLDAQLGNYSFTGIAVSGSRIESTYEFNEIGSINYDSQLTILSPYVKFTNSTQDAYLSAIFGIGSGITAINEAEGISTTQSNRIVSATLIGNQPIYSFTNAQQQNSGDLSLYGQTGWQIHNLNHVDNQNRISEVNRNLQVGATATYEQILVNASTINTTFSYEIVGEHRDRKTILGQELTNDISVVHQSGLSLSLASEFAFTPITQGHRTAISGAIAFDRYQDEVGLMIELTPTWVKTEGQVFNSQSNDHFLVAGDRGWTDPSNSKLTTELSFGLPVFDATGIVTPYAAYEMVAGEEPLFDVGVSMQTFNALQMTLNY